MTCKNHCPAPVVGHSITGTGQVCRACNLREWADGVERQGNAAMAKSLRVGAELAEAKAAA